MSTLATLPRGDQKTYAITCSESLDAATSVIFTAKKSKGLADTAATFQHALGAGVTVSGTTASVAVVHNDTASLTCATTLFCDVQASFSGRSHVTVWEGTLPVTMDVTVESDTSVPIYTTSPSATTSAIAAAAAAAAAKTAAELAEANAETAETNAETAETNAGAAQVAAVAARDAALVAQTAAELAETNAETAETNAEAAQGLAEAAKTAAETAQGLTEAARDTATGAAASATTSAGTATTQAGIATAQAGLAADSATSASASALQAAAVGVSLVNPYVNKAPRGGIVSAGTSPVGTTQDNTGLAFGTSDLTIGMWLRLPDWTPSSAAFLLIKYGINLGIAVRVETNGTLLVQFGTGSTAVSFYSTVPTGISDGAWALIEITLDRDGNAIFYVNGAQLGNAVAIAAQAAQTLTSANALYWLSNGSTAYPGTLGECWIINGLLSATRITDIYRAGSIAPFCVMTPNATTGQNTATIDGLSFYTWPEFDQGYGPIIRDRSGNNQHALTGTSGLHHVVRKNPPGLPQRAPRGALIGDGSNGSKVYATLNTQSPTTGEMVLWWDGIFPADAVATTRTLAALTSNATTAGQATSGLLQYNSSGCRFILFGATTNDYRLVNSATLMTLLAGKRAGIGVRRSSAGAKMFVAVDGDLFDASALFAESTGGTPPAWTDTVSGTYLLAGTTDASNSTAVSLYDLRLANVAMTEAQLRAEYERGEPGPEWIGASNTPIVSPTVLNGGFETAGAGGADAFANWAEIVAGTSTVTRDTSEYYAAGGGLASAKFVSDSSANMCSVGQSVIVGRKYRVSGYGKHNGTATDVQIFTGTSAVSTPLTSEWAPWSLELVATTSTLSISRRSTEANRTLWVDDVTITPIGWTTRLRTDAGGGYQARNDARSATNDSTNFDLSTTGITWSPEAPVGTRVSITGTKLHSEISATGGTTVFGVRPAGWRVVEYQQNQDVAFDTGLTLDLGTVGTPNLFVSALALDATGFKQADSLSKVPSSLTASQTIYGKKSGGTTAGNILRYTIILERTY